MSNTAENRHPPSAQSAGRRSDRIKLRRALTYTAMTLLLPGSAQVAAGNRKVGRCALIVWAALWISVLVVGAAALLWRDGAIGLFTFGPTLRVIQVVLVVLGAGEALLLMDAWRLSRPPELARRHRLGFALVNSVLIFAVGGSLIAAASVVSAQRNLMATVFAGGGDTTARNGRFNILLLGGDAGRNRSGLRPDSMTVASVDAETGRTVLLSLPRNLEDVPFPAYSPLHQKFPSGFGCPDHSCMLNAVYTYAAARRSLYPGVPDPGAQATKEAVEGATGLKINYYVLIDLKGFESLVDAVGGVTLDVNKRVPMGGGTSKVFGQIEPGRDVHLDGFHALWFARSRADSSDYERIARQKCVMSAMLNQLDPLTVLTKFNSISAAGKQIVATDIPSSDIDTLLGLALKAKTLPIASVAFVPPLIYPGSPDFALIQRRARAKIEAAEASDRGESPAKEPAATRSPAGQPTPGPVATGTPGPAASKGKRTPQPGQETDDLGEVCSAR